MIAGSTVPITTSVTFTPVSTASKARIVRISRPAPISSTIESINCATTRPRRRRDCRGATATASFSAGTRSPFADRSAGPTPKSSADSAATPKANSTTRGPGDVSTVSVSRDETASTDDNQSFAACWTIKPSAPPHSASSRLSVSSCRTMRARDAPSARRTDTSWTRAAARASERLATLAHASRNSAPTPANSNCVRRVNSRRSPGSRPAPAATCQPFLSFSGYACSRWSMAPTSPRACSSVTPGFRRATSMIHTASRLRKMSAVRKGGKTRSLHTVPSGTQMSCGLVASTPRKPGAVTPTISNRSPLSETRRPTMAGSPPNCCAQTAWLMTVTAASLPEATSASKPRPRANVTPSVRK